MIASLLLYAGCIVCAIGLVSLAWPLRLVGVRSRWMGAGLAAAGFMAAQAILWWPATGVVVQSARTALDEFAPEYQFSERHSIPIHASAWQVYDSILKVSADEIPGYRTMVWVRRGGISGPESILNPPDGVPLVAVATRTSFVTLANVPGREFVMGTVVLAPPGVRLAITPTPDSFKTLTLPGFAKATLAFRVEPWRDGWSVLRSETRVSATDYVSRATFARYWRVIAPGSALVRLMWLRAIKIRAETLAGSPAVRPPAWSGEARLVAPLVLGPQLVR